MVTASPDARDVGQDAGGDASTEPRCQARRPPTPPPDWPPCRPAHCHPPSQWFRQTRRQWPRPQPCKHYAAETTAGLVIRWGNAWWRHQMETFSAWLALCEGNPPVNGGFPSHGPVTWSFDVCFNEQTIEQTLKSPVIWDTIGLIMMSL